MLNGGWMLLVSYLKVLLQLVLFFLTLHPFFLLSILLLLNFFLIHLHRIYWFLLQLVPVMNKNPNPNEK